MAEEVDTIEARIHQDSFHESVVRLEKENWWYRSRRRFFAMLLCRYVPGAKESALDVGCGVGSNFPILMMKAERVYGIDISPEAVGYCKREKYTDVVIGAADHMPFADTSMDIVLCADVLEHVNDRTALSEIRRVLKKDGTALISVPAFTFLWNWNDDFSGHLRRYTKEVLLSRLKEAELHAEYVTYWNVSFFFPVWVLSALYRRGYLRKREENNLVFVPRALNVVLYGLLFLESKYADIFGLPFGVTLVAVIRKET